MNRKLGQLIKATLFALPLALPGVALAQSAGGDVPAPGSSTKSESSTSSTTDTTTLNKQDTNANKGYQDSQGGSSASGMSSGTMDNTDKQNAGTPDTKGAGTSDVDRTPPAGSLGTSGSSATSDRDLGGDINKSNDDTAKMNSDSTTTTRHQKKTKKTVKSTTTSDFGNDTNR